MGLNITELTKYWDLRANSHHSEWGFDQQWLFFQQLGMQLPNMVISSKQLQKMGI